jgi:hypothetical protein
MNEILKRNSYGQAQMDGEYYLVVEVDEQIAALEAEVKEKERDHQAIVKELQDMIAVLILFVPTLNERQKYVDWLTRRKV